jgi:hypothetical protein
MAQMTDVGATGLGRGGRMSRQRKRDVALRLLEVRTWRRCRARLGGRRR